MKNRYTLQKWAFGFCFLFSVFSFNAVAQVGIGTTNPNPNALLDIDASTTPGGLLLPRVNLTGTNNAAPLLANVAGMVVYNTAVAGVAPNAVTPGYYYNDGAGWVRLTDAATPNNDWSRSGNSGTTAGTNFLGTTDDISLELFTNNTSRMRVENDGQISMGFGAYAVNAGQQFNAVSNYVNGIGIGGYSGGLGSGIYGQNVDGGNGIYGLNSSDGIGVMGESYFGLGLSIYGLDGSIFSDNTFFGADAVVGYTNSVTSNGVWGLNWRSNGTGIIGGNNGISVQPNIGSGVSGSGTKLGIMGYAGAGIVDNANRGNAAGAFTLDTDSNPSTNGQNNGTRAYAKLAGFDNVSLNGNPPSQNSYFGGYFSGGNENNGNRSYAYAGIKYGADNNGRGGTNYKIIGNGTNSTLINDASGSPRIMFSPEAPEILFQDYGIGKLNNGVARIEIDPILKRALYVDNDHPLKVFVTLEGDCNGVYVTDKSINGFTVKELQNGRSNVNFSWQIVANRADDKDFSGTVTSKHVGMRLPFGPGPIPSTEASIKKKDTRFDIASKSKTQEIKDRVNEEDLSIIISPMFKKKEKKNK